jgi:hypothetical protein
MLSDKAIQALRPDPSRPGSKHHDRDGLYLWVARSGSKTLRKDYRWEGVRQTFTIGTYPKVRLADARKVATGWLTMPPRGALAIAVTCGRSWITSSCQPWERWPLVCWAGRKLRIACWLRASEIIWPSELREARWSELDPERRQRRLQLLGDCAEGKRILALAGAGAAHHWRRSALSLPERAQQGQRGNGLTKPEPSGVPTEASHSQPRAQKSRPHPGPLLSAR